MGAHELPQRVTKVGPIGPRRSAPHLAEPSPDGSSRARANELHRRLASVGLRLPAGLHAHCQVRIVLRVVVPFFYIGLSIVLARNAGSVALGLVLAFLPMLAAHRGLLTLTHDASHQFFSKRRAYNDLITDFWVAGFIGMLVRRYRTVHLSHHRANGSADDPEFVSCQEVTRHGGLAGFVLHYALGLEAIPLVRKYYAKRNGGGRVCGPTRRRGQHSPTGVLSIVWCQAVLALCLHGCAVPHLYLLWAYLAVTWSPMLSRLRFIAEHPGQGHSTLSTRGTWWERIFLAPGHFNYHLEHHLWPTLPPYRLARAHQALRQSAFFALYPELEARSFTQTLRRLLARGEHEER